MKADEKLDYPELPPVECFYSSLRQTNVLGDSPEEIQANYKLCQEVWQREGMKTFKSFLAFYNERDEGPMVKACKSWLWYYHDTDKIDVLKDTIGLPSIARWRMYEAASKFPGFMGFSLTEDSHQNLEKLIVSNTCGGPSIVFTRYHEAGKTRLRELVSQTEPDGAGDHTYCQPVGMSNGAAKLCEGVLGYDTNSLYPWCESQLLPVGPCVHYGATLLNKEKFDNIYYVGENEALLKHNDPKFRSSTYIGNGIYEVHMAHKVMKNDIPKQIGLFVLQYAKLRMLQFYYDCLDRYLDRSDFEIAQMDTDNLYFAVSKYNADQLDDLASHPLIPMVKKAYWTNLKASYTITAEHYFPRQCCAAHNQYDQKTLGLYLPV